MYTASVSSTKMGWKFSSDWKITQLPQDALTERGVGIILAVMPSLFNLRAKDWAAKCV